MSYAENPYQSPMGTFAARAAADERSDFIVKTYAHLAGAICAFVVLETIFLRTAIAESLTATMFGSQYGWLIAIGLFIFVSFVAERWARSAVSPATQYMGLGLYVAAESVLFAPLLFIAKSIDESIIPTAAVATLVLFAGLTGVVFVTRKDFSFLRVILAFGALAAFGLIVLSIVTGMALGPIFTYAMIALACGYILFYTSNVMHHYRIGQHVAASLALFAAVALLFWYIVQLLMSMSRD